MHKLARVLFFVGLLFMFSGVAFALALFFVPNEYAPRVVAPALIFFVLFLIDVPIYNYISEKIEKNEHTNDEP